jgi:hypothetical protein
MEPTLCCASSDILKEKKKNWCQRHPRFSVISKASRKSIYIGFYQRTGGYVICRVGGGGVPFAFFHII